MSHFSDFATSRALELNRGKFGVAMAPDQRIVTKIPLTELWDESGTLSIERLRTLDQRNLVELLRAGPLQFVVADCGLKLIWIPTQQRFELWKKVKSQIADPAERIHREQFPNETARWDS